MLDGVTVCSLTMKELHVAGDFIPEAIATLGGDLLDGGTIGLKTECSGSNASHHLRGRSAGSRGAAAIRSIDPTVRGHDEVVCHEVGVAGLKATEENNLRIGLARALGVTQPNNLLLGDDDDAVLIETEAGDQLEAFMENLLLVEHAVVLARNEDADFIPRRAVVITRLQDATFLPGFGAERASAVRILRSFGDPQATAFVPLLRNRLIDEGLSSNNLGLKAWLHPELSNSIISATRTADRIT